MRIGVTEKAQLLAALLATVSARVTMITTSGRACRANCIDQGQFFCAAEDFEVGICCDIADEVCRQGEFALCSFDIPQNVYLQSHYFACPYDTDICGPNRTIQVLDNGEGVEMTNLGN